MPFTLLLFCVSMLCRILAIISFGIGIYHTRRIKKTGEKSPIPLICSVIGFLLLLGGMGISRYLRENINMFDYYNF